MPYYWTSPLSSVAVDSLTCWASAICTVRELENHAHKHSLSWSETLTVGTTRIYILLGIGSLSAYWLFSIICRPVPLKWTLWTAMKTWCNVSNLPCALYAGALCLRAICEIKAERPISSSSISKVLLAPHDGYGQGLA
jgi:hypothetical protein